MQKYHTLIAITLSIFITACGSLPTNNCQPGLEKSVQESLYFGTDRKGGIVTPEEWTTFLDTTVTPRFPNGLTVTSASGQWRGKDDVIVKEDSYVLTLVHPGTESMENAINEIISAYKTQFQQEAVLRVTNAVCVSF